MDKNDLFNGGLFDNVDFNKVSTKENVSTNNGDEDLFDLSRGKKLIGVGNKTQNFMDGLIKHGARAIAGGISFLIGVYMMLEKNQSFFGLIFMGIGAYILLKVYLNWKNRCQQCGRFGAMELLVSDELSAERSSTRYDVYVNGKYSHYKMKYNSKFVTDDLYCCKYCGCSKSTISTF